MRSKRSSTKYWLIIIFLLAIIALLIALSPWFLFPTSASIRIMMTGSFFVTSLAPASAIYLLCKDKKIQKALFYWTLFISVISFIEAAITLAGYTGGTCTGFFGSAEPCAQNLLLAIYSKLSILPILIVSLFLIMTPLKNTRDK